MHNLYKQINKYLKKKSEKNATKHNERKLFTKYIIVAIMKQTTKKRNTFFLLFSFPLCFFLWRWEKKCYSKIIIINSGDSSNAMKKKNEKKFEHTQRNQIGNAHFQHIPKSNKLHELHMWTIFSILFVIIVFFLCCVFDAINLYDWIMTMTNFCFFNVVIEYKI